ncbi:MAG: hypothetical protein AAGA91_05050 [Pseudomonadota bacterium]
MNRRPKTLLDKPLFNDWALYAWISVPVSLVMVWGMVVGNLRSGPGISELIQLSVRLSIPWLYLAFAASSLQVLFPGAFSRWLLRNRKIMGLCFATAMGWQLLFILWMVILYSDYYANEVYVFTDLLEGVVGYAFLMAMTITSFKFGRRYLSSGSWKLLHKCGIYALWGYAWLVYWYAIFYYESPDAIDYLYYLTGTLAWGLRIAAWVTKRRRQALRTAVAS